MPNFNPQLKDAYFKEITPLVRNTVQENQKDLQVKFASPKNSEESRKIMSNFSQFKDEVTI